MPDDFLFDDSFEPSTEWARAIDIQLDLIRWWETEQGQRFGAGFGETYATKVQRAMEAELGPGSGTFGEAMTFPQGLTPDELRDFAERHGHRLATIDAYRNLATMERARLASADTYYVTEEIAERISDLARALPKDLESTESMVPSRGGFVYVPSGLMTMDARGEMYAVKAIAWGVGPAGFNRTIYSDPRDDRETDEIADRFHDGTATAVRAPLLLFDAQGALWGPLFKATYLDPFALDGFEYDPATVEAASADSVFGWRWLVAFWLFCQEEITILARPKRGATRRAERVLNLAPSELSVRVVRLRKAKYVHPDGTVVAPRVIEWSHRWRVRAHKRVLHRGTGDEKVVWVSEYVKGPDHAPLIERDDIMVVHR